MLIIGDTWQWSRTFSEFPPSEGWTVAYYLNGPVDLTFAASVSGSQYSVLVAAATTAALTPGTYQWAAYATGSGSYAGQRFQITAGVFTVIPNLTTAAAFTTHEEKVLASLEAAIEARAAGDFESYTVGGAGGSRSIQKIPIEKLLALRAIYQQRVWRTRNPGKLGPIMAVNFGPPS